MQEVYSHTFPNGLTLLAEPMPHVRSAAMNFLVPAGCAYDPPEMRGLASMLADLITRGAGDRDSRELALALDSLGFDGGESVGPLTMRLSGATLGSHLPAVLELYADILRRPQLPEEELEPAQLAGLQELQGLEDSPPQKVITELRRRHYPEGLNKDRFGTEEGIQSVTIDAVRQQFQRRVLPRGTILGVAGKIEWEPIRDHVERLFGDWQGNPEPTPPFGENRHVRVHFEKKLEQTQIAMAWPGVPLGHADYYPARGAEGVLSGGMSARLFEEVREQRGLCYGIHASLETFKDRGTMLFHTACVADRAQETLDLSVQVLRSIAEEVEDDEVDRVKAGLKSSLIMQGESTSARAGAIASDWYYLGRVRTLDEIHDAIDGLTADAIREYAVHHPADNFSLVSLGPAAVTLE